MEATMGDRATVQLFDKDGDFSPILYVHWAGHRVQEILEKAAPVMRKGEASYAFARMVGVFHNETKPDQKLSLGVWNATEIQKSDEQGDAGHFSVNIDTGEVINYGGAKLTLPPLKL